jgi:hypothetical protein
MRITTVLLDESVLILLWLHTYGMVTRAVLYQLHRLRCTVIWNIGIKFNGLATSIIKSALRVGHQPPARRASQHIKVRGPVDSAQSFLVISMGLSCALCGIAKVFFETG